MCLLLIILLFSCQSINSTRQALGLRRNTVFLTFDDGPDEHTTAKLLDVLEKYQIKALFCLLGVNAEHYPELVRRIYNEGHCIINHGYSDKWAIKMDDDEFRDNLLRGASAIAASLGYDSLPRLLYRPQFGDYNLRQKKICIEEGYTIVPVSIRVHDAVLTAADKKRVVNDAVNLVIMNSGGMILLHDARDSYYRKAAELEKAPNGPFNRTWIPDAVEEIIIALLNKGFDLQAEMPFFD